MARHPGGESRPPNVTAQSMGAKPDATIGLCETLVTSTHAVREALGALPQFFVGDSRDKDFVELGVLGEGGMGIVRVAHQRSLDREVAIKGLRPESADNAAAVAALLAEARIQGALEHPNVVPIHALGVDAAGLPVLVMKRLSGVSWRALMHDPDHPAWPRDAGDRLTWHLRTLIQICNAVHFAHSRGIVHRDIKPANVMVGEFGEVYLSDWGLGYCPGADDAELDTKVVGTPSYIAPEMLIGSGPHIDVKTDVYLLGAVLHEILTGTVRHVGDDVLSTLLRAAESSPVDYPPSIPVELAALCNRATSRDPDARPGSALAFRHAIEQYLEHRGSLALTEAASLRFAALRSRARARLDTAGAAGADDLEIRTLFGEASFGYLQALRAWEENVAAQRRLLELRTWMFKYELSQRNAVAAAALLVHLPDAQPELVARLESLRGELARERAELENLRGVAHELNPAVDSEARRIAAAFFSVLIAGGAVAVWRVRPTGPTHADMLAVTFLLGLIVAIVLAVFREAMLSTRHNRRFWFGLGLLPALYFINHFTCMCAGVSVQHAFVTNLLIGATVLAALGVLLTTFVAALAMFLVVGAVLAALWPAYTIEITAIAVAVASMASIVFGQRAIEARVASAPGETNHRR